MLFYPKAVVPLPLRKIATGRAAAVMDSLKANRRPVILFLDFDGTVTKKDTLHLVAKVAYVHHEKRNPSVRPSLPPWEHFGDAYMQDFRNHRQQYTPKKEERSSLKDEIAWLRSLRGVEEASIKRAIQSGLFDVENPLPALERVIQEEQQSIEVRPGLERLLEEIHERNVSSLSSVSDSSFNHIISVNWSRIWIQSVLKKQVTASSSSDSKGNIKGEFQIFANEVFNGALQDSPAGMDQAEAPLHQIRTNSGDSTRGVCCTTSEDKVLQMQRIIREWQKQFSSKMHNLSQPLSLYVGDSATDLECLTEADIGICIRDEPMGSGQKELAETCQRIGVTLTHISEFNLDPAKPPQQLWWARDFQDISNWLHDTTGLDE